MEENEVVEAENKEKAEINEAKKPEETENEIPAFVKEQYYLLKKKTVKRSLIIFSAILAIGVIATVIIQNIIYSPNPPDTTLTMSNYFDLDYCSIYQIDDSITERGYRLRDDISGLTIAELTSDTGNYVHLQNYANLYFKYIKPSENLKIKEISFRVYPEQAGYTERTNVVMRFALSFGSDITIEKEFNLETGKRTIINFKLEEPFVYTAKNQQKSMAIFLKNILEVGTFRYAIDLLSFNAELV